MTSPGKISLIYAVLGALWILLSDAVVYTVFKTPTGHALAENLKGIFYILVTTFLIYFTLKAFIKNIEKQEAKVQLLATNTLDVIWAIDMSLQFTYINPAIENIVGISPDELIGKHVRQICPEKTMALIEEALTHELQKGVKSKGLVFTAEHVHKDGRHIPVEISGRIIFDENNNPCSIQGVSRDIRERVAMQTQLRQAQKMESIGTMASGIAHEVNNPISKISICAELLMRSQTLPESEKKLLKTITDESLHIHEIIANLLGYVRVEQNPKTHLISPAVPLEKSLELMSTTLRHDHITLKKEIAKDLPEILCYPNQIQQILLNLLDNSKDALNEKLEDATDNKCIEVSLSKSGDDSIRYKILDYGKGMSVEQLEKVFDPFYTTKPEGKGTGLGMWIILQIIKNHHGFIIIESLEDHYTQIEIELPLDFRKPINHKPSTIQVNIPDIKQNVVLFE